MDNTTAPAHRFTFARSGGVDQVVIETGDDLRALGQLDQKLWVALACPVVGLEVDAVSLGYVDTDDDGRVRAPEVLGAVRWLCEVLKDPALILTPGADLPLAAIAGPPGDGPRVRAAAEAILARAGKVGASSISVDESVAAAAAFAASPFNGDGILPPASAPEGELRRLLGELVTAAGGGKVDASGAAGVDLAQVEAVFADAAAFSAWWARAEADPTILPLGGGTAAAASAVAGVAAKVEDFFARCRVAAFDPRALDALNGSLEDLAALARHDLSAAGDELAALPLAHVAPGASLPLTTGLNPAWMAPMAALRTQCVLPLLGDVEALTEVDWASIRARLASFLAWEKDKAGLSVEALGLGRVREILAGDLKDQILALFTQEEGRKDEAEAIRMVDRLTHLRRDMRQILENFVNFRDFYDPGRRATFQAGVMYVDRRSLDLVIRVGDVARHSSLAAPSGAYLAYFDCVRPATGAKLSVVAAFTDGDSDHLAVGRNGLFYDRQGNDWDATIVKIVDNPLSLRQAFFAPYRRLGRWIEEQISSRASAADAAATTRLQGAATNVGDSAATGKAPGEKPKVDVGLIAALGVAVGGIVAALGAMMDALFGLGIWMPLGILGVVLAISGPSMISAWLKLRKRSLAPLLDANGWAVNASARINIPFGRALTHLAELPPGADRDLRDPYQEEGRGPLFWVGLVVGLVLAGLVAYQVVKMGAQPPLPPPPPPAEEAPAG